MRAARLIPEFERSPFARVVSMSAEAARRFFGAPEGARVVDGGPPVDPERYQPGARVWHVYPAVNP